MKPSRPTNSSPTTKPPPPEPQTAAQLRELQRLMARAVMRPLDAAGRMRTKWADGGSAKKVAAGFIKPNDRLTSFERLQIYNRQYWFRVLDCLADDFCGVRAVTGEDAFAELAVAYLTRHPSGSFTLRNLGRHFSDFIRAEPRWTAPRQQLALDMARLEWAHIEAFDNESKPPLSASDLSGRDASRLRLRLQPHLRLLQLGWPLDDYLIALRENSGLRGEASNAIVPSAHPRRARKPALPRARPVSLAVHRHLNTVYYKRLEPIQFQLLTAIGKRPSLERALRVLPAGEEPAVQDWFQEWSSLGWFWLAS